MSLQIDKVEWFLVKVPLRFSVEHALAKRKANLSGFLILTDKDRRTGVGEFLCREYVTNESPEDCIHYLNKIKSRLLRTFVENPLDLIHSLWNEDNDPGKLTILCAVDLALLDLWSKTNSKSIQSLFHVKNSAAKYEIQYSAVYPFARGLKFNLLNFFYQSYKQMEDIKIKGTGDILKDIDYLTKIRKTYRHPVKIRFDLNGSLSPDKAGEYFEQMVKSDVTWFEQPFQKNNWESASRFQKSLKDIILCADESICTIADLEKAAKEDAFHAVNIRIGKNGGLTNALEIYQKATELGLKVQLGCLVGESSVLSYAGLHFASLAGPLEHYEGCFGKYLIKWDVIKPSLMFSHKGKIDLKHLPKFGITPFLNADVIRRQTSDQGEKF